VSRAPDLQPGPTPAVIGGGPAVKACAYLALFGVGCVQALLGTFHYSNRPAPLLAVCFALAILVTCVLGAWGMRTAMGGVLPAGGWYIVSLVLGTSGAGGSVLVTDSTAGTWFLFGGAGCAAAGALIAFARWSRPGAARRSGR
jgi:hypothetical protein